VSKELVNEQVDHTGHPKEVSSSLNLICELKTY